MTRRKKIWLIVLAAIVLIAVAFAIYLFPLDGFEDIVDSQVNDLIPDKLGLSVEVGDIAGSLFSGVILRDVVVTYTDSSVSYECVRVGRIILEYSLSSLLSEEYNFKLVELDSLQVTILRDTTGRLIIPPLGGDGEGSESSLALAVEQLSIRNGSFAIRGESDSLTVTGISFAGSARIEGKMVAADVLALSLNLPDREFELTSASGKVTYSGDQLVFKDFILASGQRRARLSGSISLDELAGQLEIAVDKLDLSSIQELGGPKLSGVMDINGRIEFDTSGFEGSVNLAGDIAFASLENLQADFSFAGKRLQIDSLYGFILGTCAIDGSGYLDLTNKPERYGLSAEIRNFDLRKVVKNSFESDLNGRIELDGTALNKTDLRLLIKTDLYESEFDGYPMHVSGGDLAITTDSLVFETPFRVTHFENMFTARGGVAFSENLSVDIEASLPQLERYRGRFFIDEPGGRGSASVRLRGATSDPDLVATFVSDSVWLYSLYAGQCSISVDIDRFLGRRQGTVDAYVAHGAAWGSPFDSVSARLTLDSQIVFVDSVTTASVNLVGWAIGSFDYGVYPAQVRVDTVALDMFGRQLYNRGKIHVVVDSTGYLLQSLSVHHGEGVLSAAGIVGTDQTIDVTVEIDSILLAPWTRLMQYEMDVDGFVSGDVSLWGSFANPRFLVDGRVDSLAYNDYLLGDLQVGALYDERLLSIDSVVLIGPGRNYRIEGTTNLDISFMADSIYRLPDLPMDLTMTVQETEFAHLIQSLPSLEDVNGRFNGSVQLSGTPDQPHFEGSAHLVNGEIKYFDVEEWIYADSAHMEMVNNLIILDDVSVYLKPKSGPLKGKKRYASLGGSVEVKSLDEILYNVSVQSQRELPFSYELEDITGIVRNAMVTIEGASPPTIDGEMTLARMDYNVPFAKSTEGSPVLTALSQNASWDIDIIIDIPSDYWVRNEDIEAEFSGDIHIIRESGRYSFSGSLSVVRGKAYLFDKVFQLEPGGSVIFDGSEGLNPRLELQARSRIPGRPIEGEQTAEPIDLCIRVTGTLDFPQIDVCTDSDLSNEDILSLIAFNSYGDQRLGGNAVLGERLSQYVGNKLSQIAGRQLGVETFQIDPAYEGELDFRKARLTVGKSISRNLYAYLRTDVSLSQESEVGFEYRFSRKFLLEGRRTEDEEYALNFKVHWEF